MSSIEFSYNEPCEVTNPTRFKRLLMIAQPNKPPYRDGRRLRHKSYYHNYYYMVYERYIDWHLGTAFRTEKGEEKLKELLCQQ